jgi:hypothetical protein
LSFTALTALCSGCAYVTEGSIQDVTVVTPGATNAQCKLSVGSVKYVYEPPMTRSIQKTDETMEVDCWAPGNRHKVVYIKPNISGPTMYNAGTGIVPGMAWDFASKAMYFYPKVVEVDFTQTEIKPFPLPAQNQDDIRQPEDYDLEEFSPGLPRLNSDRFATNPEIRRREVPTDFDLQGFAGQEGAAQGAAQGATAPGSAAPEAVMARQTSKVRVIGRANEGVSVPTPPSPEQQAAAAAARAAQKEADQTRAASEAQQAMPATPVEGQPPSDPAQNNGTGNGNGTPPPGTSGTVPPPLIPNNGLPR